MLMDGSEAGFKNIQFCLLIIELTGSDDSGAFFLLCVCYQAKKPSCTGDGFQVTCRWLEADESSSFYSGPQTIGPCADTWMLVLQYHWTSGIYVSKFQLKPRKCQSKQREAAWEKGEGAAFGTQEWVSWTVPSPNCTKHTGKLTWLPKARDFFGVFLFSVVTAFIIKETMQ